MTGARVAAGLLGAGQTGAGLALLLRPRAALRVVADADDDLSRVAARVLGARLAAQGLLVAGFGGTRALRASALIDAVHAVTMAVPAFGRSGRERAARLSGVCSLLSAAVASRIAARMARTA